MSDIRIDAPGAGDWIVGHWRGCFREGFDHTFTSHDGERILGGILLCDYMGSSMAMHMVGSDPRWFSRELAWLAFHYAFEQVGCRKLLAPVRSDNYKAIALNLRGGWKLETVIYDAFDAAHMVVMSMTRDACPWLNYQPKQWREAA